MAVTFASKLGNDGTLAVPKQAVDELGIHPGDIVTVSVEPAGAGGQLAAPSLLAQAKYKMTHRTKEQIAEAQARAMG